MSFTAASLQIHSRQNQERRAGKDDRAQAIWQKVYLPEYLHWLGSVYVRPEDRNQGIGCYLIEYAAKEARRLGVEDLYLYTTDRESLYSRLGWITIDRVEYHGHPVVIMKRTLNL